MSEPEAMEAANCKDILTKLGPLETLLGSVSYNDIDNADGKTQQLRTSARVFKKMKFDLSNSTQEKKIEEKKEVKLEEVKIEVVKKMLPSPLWTLEERCLFFEALNECGKDFESMHSYISTRLRKKGLSEDTIKNKYQVRHFYYRTFHMILKYIKFPDNIPKNALELYALINYGEVRRKIGLISKKNWTKLLELIQNGSSSMRSRGKTIRVKTPMCKALRRLNLLDEKYDDLKLPTRVILELKPKDMASFVKVQTIAQNPRIKVVVSLQTRLGSLITCVNQRWKSPEALVYDKATVSTNAITKEFVPEKKVFEENAALFICPLRLIPPSEACIELPSIDLSEYFTGQSICMNAYEMRRNEKLKDEVLKDEKLKVEVKKEDPDAKIKVEPEVSIPETAPVPDSSKSEKITYNTKAKIKEITTKEKQIRIEQIKQGWTIENCGSVTVGEVYLMFGANSKVCLEYCWESPLKTTEEAQGEVREERYENIFTNSLKKLLSLAKLNTEPPPPPPNMKCPCGHVCGTKTTAQFKKPATTKVVKKAQIVQTAAQDKDESKQNKRETNPEQNKTVVQLLHQRENLQNVSRKIRARLNNRYKQLVVERKLVPSKSDSEHQIVSMNFVPQDFKNEASSDSKDSTTSGVSSLFRTGRNEENLKHSFTDILADNLSESGISKILGENDNEWMNSEVSDYSLSSLLDHLDGQSNCNTNQSMISMPNEDTKLALSQDVDAQLRTLLLESSVDYTAQFADLAEKVTARK